MMGPLDILDMQLAPERSESTWGPTCAFAHASNPVRKLPGLPGFALKHAPSEPGRKTSNQYGFMINH